jgi:hypothetical protein
MSALWIGKTCLPVGKRRRAAAVQTGPSFTASRQQRATDLGSNRSRSSASARIRPRSLAFLFRRREDASAFAGKLRRDKGGGANYLPDVGKPEKHQKPSSVPGSKLELPPRGRTASYRLIPLGTAWYRFAAKKFFCGGSPGKNMKGKNRHLTLSQWLPKPATRWFPQLSYALRATWSPIEAERVEKRRRGLPLALPIWRLSQRGGHSR